MVILNVVCQHTLSQKFTEVDLFLWLTLMNGNKLNTVSNLAVVGGTST